MKTVEQEELIASVEETVNQMENDEEKRRLAEKVEELETAETEMREHMIELETQVEFKDNAIKEIEEEKSQLKERIIELEKQVAQKSQTVNKL